MKLCGSGRRTRAMTLLEAVVVLFLLFMPAIVLLPALTKARSKGGPNCSSNLKQAGLSFLIWQGDNDGKLPMDVSVTNAGAREFAAVGNAEAIFCVMSNELSTPGILLCPADKGRHAATNFTLLTAENVSYFVGLDAITNDPQALLSGDDNLELDGKPIKSELQSISTDATFVWSKGRHNHCGNSLFADGHVELLSSSKFVAYVGRTNSAPIRLAIP